MLLILVNLIHIVITLFILLSPFTDSAPLLLVHISSVISILLHWGYNNDTCFLTLVECKMRGIEQTQSFINSIVSPVYKFNEVDTSNMCYIFITLLGLVSVYKLYKKSTKNLQKIYKNLHDNPERIIN
jgi:hypothetical protein